MKQAQWIWYPGDFEIYHSNLVHSRREDFGVDYPPVWMQFSPYPRVDFVRDFECHTAHTVRVLTRSYGMVILDGQLFSLNTDIALSTGKHSLLVRLFDTAGLPSIYIDDEDCGTDAEWRVSNGSANFVPVGAKPVYARPEDDPTVFRFSYSELPVCATERTETGLLYDFGKETFGPVHLSGFSEKDTVRVCYGESREEALDWENAYIRETLCGGSDYDLKPRAFRFIHVEAPQTSAYRLRAEYEYLPIPDVGSFSCEDPLIKKIWDTCAYTFHLNSREFYQDGIKRDRWVWSGDSYQSFMINRYLYLDPEITKRTILALLGKPPYEQHVNTINDYTLYLIISLWDYYYSSGDLAFVRQYWPRFKALYRFVTDRLDENGLMVARPGDWIFIDWSPMDKDGALCAEQIVLWKATKCMASLAQLCGEAAEPLLARADALKAFVDEHFWDGEKQAYIDCYTTGKRNVTRHANIFAILYDFADEERKRAIMQYVLENDAITQITTPYFKFFELSARCKMGDLASSQRLLTSYWGGMLRDGATSIWEQYDPNASGTEHYAMYGTKFGCSLCHAWGSGPIFLLGRYCLGVEATDVGYRTFRVKPNRGIFRELHGTVPLHGGKRVSVDYADGVLRVTAEQAGGTLEVGGRSIPLPEGKTVELSCAL